MADDEGEGGPRQTTPVASGAGGGGKPSPFSRKFGVLPLWGWMAALLIIAGGVYLWKRNKTASTTDTTDTSTTATDASGTQTPPFIIQNYTTTGGAGATGATGAAGATGATGPAGPAGTGTPPVTTPPKPPVKPPSTPTKPTSPPKTTKPAAPQVYTVKAGDNLSTIAAAHHIPGGLSTGWKILWAYNTSAANRKAAKLPPVQGDNPDLIYPGEKILIPAT